MGDRLFIKRIIGIPGDTLRIYQGTVIRNGSQVSEPYALHLRGYRRLTDLWPVDTLDSGTREVSVPPKRYFVLGDNRDESYDSREFGFVSEDQIIGRVIYIFRHRPSLQRCNSNIAVG